MNCEDKFLND